MVGARGSQASRPPPELTPTSGDPPTRSPGSRSGEARLLVQRSLPHRLARGDSGMRRHRLALAGPQWAGRDFDREEDRRRWALGDTWTSRQAALAAPGARHNHANRQGRPAGVTYPGVVHFASTAPPGAGTTSQSPQAECGRRIAHGLIRQRHQAVAGRLQRPGTIDTVTSDILRGPARPGAAWQPPVSAAPSGCAEPVIILRRGGGPTSSVPAGGL